MSGTTFRRADLHVHTRPDDNSTSDPIENYIQAAIDHDVEVLAITDHNSIDRVEEALHVASTSPIYLVPGMEITTFGGHLLALFSRDNLGQLRSLASNDNMPMSTSPSGAERCTRHVLELAKEIYERGGLAILAHVDEGDGPLASLSASEMESLLCSPALAALELRDQRNLATWFTDADTDNTRKAAWSARNSDKSLAVRGLARITSSDAHCADNVGKDRPTRQLTRLKMDELNWTSIRNSIVYNPRSRCKPEPPLPLSYPRLVSASFEGGFLDGVAIDFSSNLNCLIGGRGSGKSTVLLAIKAAIGADLGDEDPNQVGRMPDVTRVDYIDAVGNERSVVRHRDGEPLDADTGVNASLKCTDLSQEESGHIAHDYRLKPRRLLAFLDQFVDLEDILQQEQMLIEDLRRNATEILATLPNKQRIEELRKTRAELQRTLDKAKGGNIENVAKYARILAAEGPLLDELYELVTASDNGVVSFVLDVNVDALATIHQADLSERPAAEFVDRLRQEIASWADEGRDISTSSQHQMAGHRAAAKNVLLQWKRKHDEWQQATCATP